MLCASLVFALPAHASPNGGVTPGSTSTSGGTGTPAHGGTTAGGSSTSGGGSSTSGATPSTPTGGTSGSPTGGTAFVPSGGAGPAATVPTSTDTTFDDDGKAGASARADVPAAYLKLYKAAAKQYGVPWVVLAAIGKNETDHGRSLLPGVLTGLNSAGCCSGPMQLCQVESCGEVWQYYAIDADGDG